MLKKVKSLKTTLASKLRYHKLCHTYYRPYDYLYDMYYDEFEDASKEDIEIYLTQMAVGKR